MLLRRQLILQKATLLLVNKATSQKLGAVAGEISKSPNAGNGFEILMVAVVRSLVPIYSRVREQLGYELVSACSYG